MDVSHISREMKIQLWEQFIVFFRIEMGWEMPEYEIARIVRETLREEEPET